MSKRFHDCAQWMAAGCTYWQGNEMSPAILSGVFALVGVFLGGLATHSLSLRREREARQHSIGVEHRAMLRAKYEELYTLVSRWALNISMNSLGFASAMQGRITYDDANDLFLKNIQGHEVPFERLELLLQAYTPECQGAFDRCIAARSRLNAVHAEFREQYDRNGPSGVYRQLAPYTDAARAFESDASELKGGIVACLQKLP